MVLNAEKCTFDVVEHGIQKKLQEVEVDTGLLFSWVRNSNELTKALGEGLIELYQEVFADPPYNEAFSRKEIIDGFRQALYTGGLIFTAATSDGRKTIAFAASVPLEAEPIIAQAVNHVVNTKKTSYFSEDGVAKAWRRRGLSSRMKRLLLTANFLSGFENVVLRTSIYNYPQISAISKSGGIVIPNLFQDVKSHRRGGSIVSDRRAFYLFNSNWAQQEKCQKILQRVSITRPGGNDTAVVWDQIERIEQKEIALNIQQTFPGVEQVMFIEPSEATAFRGQMAGGEFCGNATRSLGYLALGTRDGKRKVEVSGATRPLTVRVRKGFSKTQIPILNNLDCVQPLHEKGEYIVKMEGISFLITFETINYGSQISSLDNLEDQKKRVLEILNECRLSDEAASGLLVLKRQQGGDLAIDPYVYVRDTGTLYYESGCGSGTTAIGLVFALESGQSISNQKIIQPSGMNLYVSVRRNKYEFLEATVDGPIEVLLDGKIHLYRPPAIT